MKEEQINVIRLLREQDPEAFGRPATEEEIESAENILGVKLPEAYKIFLREFGAGGVGRAIILGLSSSEWLYTPSFTKITQEFREEFKDELPEYADIVVIGIDGSGNPVGFLPGEPTIFTQDHDFGGRYDLAEDFCDYVDKALNRTLEASF